MLFVSRFQPIFRNCTAFYALSKKTHLMPINSVPTKSDIAVENSNMIVKNELHTKYATPQKLSRELKDLLGDSIQFKVEVS